MPFVGAAGVLVAWVGPAYAFYLDALTYPLSGLILLGLPPLRPEKRPQGGFFGRVKEVLTGGIPAPSQRATPP